MNQHLLAEPDVARIVVDAIGYGGTAKRPNYKLHSYVVMSNHVHLLIDPMVQVSVLLKSLKGFSARRANALLGRGGLPFWQKESFDHWIRDEAEFRKAVEYIEGNPVTAGLVSSPEDFQWSSAAVQHSRTKASSSDVNVGDFDLEVEATATSETSTLRSKLLSELLVEASFRSPPLA